MRLLSIVFLLLCMCAIPGVILSAETVAIVHKDCAEQSLSLKDIKNIYVARKRSWANGSKIVICTLNKGDSHEQFLRQVVSKTPSQFRAFWRKLVFTGKGRMPKVFTNDQEAMAYVAEHLNAIAYVDKQSVAGSESVRIVATVSPD